MVCKNFGFKILEKILPRTSFEQRLHNKLAFKKTTLIQQTIFNNNV